jgi:hypothetical protein
MDYNGNIQQLQEDMKVQEAVPGFKEMTKDLAGQMVTEIDKTSVDQLNQDWLILQDDAKKKFLDEHRTIIDDSDLTVFPRPKESCPKCYGKGFEGVIWGDKGRDVLICRCIKNAIGQKDRECLTYKEFKQMLWHCDQTYNLGGKYEIFTEDVQGAAKGTDLKRDESTARGPGQEGQCKVGSSEA